jgi:Prenylcysteine lyase
MARLGFQRHRHLGTPKIGTLSNTLECAVGLTRAHEQWQAYPKLPPTTSFPPVKLDEGFYYVNAFEPYVVPHIVHSYD